MSNPASYAATWRMLMEVISTAVKLRGDGPAPLILSSLPQLPASEAGDEPFSFIQGPPGRNIAIAVGLRAALPDVPILLIMNSDAITLGTNHLSHAARRNVRMTLLLLRSELTGAENEPLDRVRWGSPGFQESIETAATPLEWAKALDAALVARGNINDPDALAALINDAIVGNVRPFRPRARHHEFTAHPFPADRISGLRADCAVRRQRAGPGRGAVDFHCAGTGVVGKASRF